VDDAAHGTLMIAAATVGSDPKIEPSDMEHSGDEENEEALAASQFGSTSSEEIFALLEQGITGVEDERG
jgi:hypothetical protein